MKRVSWRIWSAGTLVLAALGCTSAEYPLAGSPGHGISADVSSDPVSQLTISNMILQEVACRSDGVETFSLSADVGSILPYANVSLTVSIDGGPAELIGFILAEDWHQIGPDSYLAKLGLPLPPFQLPVGLHTLQLCATVPAHQPACGPLEFFEFTCASNVPPVVGVITAPIAPVPVNSTIAASADFTDANVADTHTGVFDWGDATTSSATITEANGSGTASGSHTYNTAGVYPITLTVTDNPGASGQGVFEFVVVYDPSAGFVSGGGWITSPPGAFAVNPSLTGKATFGFVSRYQKGATVPSGNTQFQFQEAGFNFRSTSYDWLVIAGARAQYKGSGMINAAGDFGFLLTAIDGAVSRSGGVDRFRLKVWDKATGFVIYDNQVGADETADPTTVLGGGDIVIHK